MASLDIKTFLGRQRTKIKRTKFSNSFIHSGYLYSTTSRNLLRGVLSPATAKGKCLKSLQKKRHVVPGQQAQCKREFIPSGGANNRGSSTLFNRRAGPRNQELDGKLNLKPAYRDQSSKMGHNQLQIARQVLKSYTKCIGRQEAIAGHHACKQKPRHIWRYDQRISAFP